MIWILLTLSLCALKVSDKDIRLPIYNEKEGVRPFQVVKFYTEDIDFIAEDPNLIDIDIISRDPSSTEINISVKYSKKRTRSTSIKLKIGEKNSEFPVTIDVIDHITIVPLTETLTVNHLTPFQVQAFNKKNESFTSLEGIKIEWIPDSDEQYGLFLPDNEDLKVIYPSLPINYAVVKGVKNCVCNLTCKLTNLNIVPAIYTLNFKTPVIFYPIEIYTTQKAEISLFLYYAGSDNTPIALVDLSNESNEYELFSDSPEIASVSNTGKVTTGGLGKATITAISKNNLSEPAKTVINVIYPDGYIWGEQWIKPSDEPDISNITVLYRNNPVTFSKNCPIRLGKSFENIGTNSVQLIFRDIDYTIYGTVHTCPPISVENENLNLRVGETEYQFKINGGSGHFDLSFDKELLKVVLVSCSEGDDGVVVSTFEVDAIKVGKTVIKITDQKIDDYKIELNVDSLESSEL